MVRTSGFMLLMPCGIIFGHCEYAIIVFWGKPTNYSSINSTTVTTSSWNDCVNYCFNEVYCVLAAGNDSSCIIYYFDTVFEVVRLEEMNGLKVAMKINSTSETCPESTSTSFSNLTISDPTYPYTVFTYSISYLDDSWKFDYNVTRTCPPDWKLYNRPLSDYCLKLYGNPNATYNQQQATDFCDTQNATLAGLESYEERNAMTSQGFAINLQDPRGLPYSGFWVSGIRKSSCSTLAEVKTTACNGTGGFDYTDKYLSTLSGYIWAPGNPDGVNASGAYQNCVMLRTQTNGTLLLGVVDDVQCTYTTGTAFDIHGFVCGKIPGI
ncbi:hypothetical protein GCK72_012838 [Caenorhabditis remanei]|uniref:PAN-3 domain-containing protein n=1 Tax=Caenorhabditis remanei TaxID=31234 RepID=A0A6A5GPF0_CAERE|nr:hypothetical protein GCK72_012838 [Caenorhabditis remanei]KAF1756385.1 hypothetical protein GCK72_012838 [Caenorhabditis remanei]